jgi:anti-sigma regulatory factor (Ser/Thr protein kinase)
VEQVMRGTLLSIDHDSRVAEVRRLAQVTAEEEGLRDPGKAAIVATELATNILKHAGKGEMQVAGLSPRGSRGVEILAMDRGPGIANLKDSLQDGRSTAGTSGTGMGAVRRMSDEFEVYSQPGKVTVLMARMYAAKGKDQRPSCVVGVTERPLSGEAVSGDSWGIRCDGDTILLMVADGLGHGLLAAAASEAALNAFHHSTEQEPTALVEAIHRALRGTRGAAVAVASVEFGRAHVRFSGLGNVAGTILSAGKSIGMVSHNGIAGHEARLIREFTYPLTSESVVIMHSDGLSGGWMLARTPELWGRHPALISGVLYAEAARERDDACVVVARRKLTLG